MFEITSDLPMLSIHMYQLSSKVTISQVTSCFLCILKGCVTITSDNCITSELCAEDIIYLPSESNYRFVAKEPSLLMYIEFHPYFLLSAMGVSYQGIHFDSRTYPPNGTNTLREDLASLAANYISDSTEKKHMLIPNSYQIFYHIASVERASQTVSSQLSKADRKVQQYKDYVEANYFRQLTLSQVAEHMGYTPQYLANFLKKNLHLTFQEHLNSIRLHAALLLLKYSKEAPHRISALCGFTNTLSFENIFQKKYQQSPEDFQAAYQLPAFMQPANAMTEIANPTLMLDYLYNYMNFLPNRDLIHDESIIQSEKLNVTKYSAFTRNWNQIINIGSAIDFEKPMFRYSLKMLQKHIPFQYGRCVDALSLIDEQSNNGHTYFNFSRLFDMLDFMRSIHMLPFIELSNKPFHIYKVDERIQSDYTLFLDTQTYDAYLYKVLPHFVRACISRYGYDEFNTWKFELWRRYTPAMNSLEEPDTYVTRFQHVAELLKSLVPEVILGGPGFNTFLDDTNFYDLMNAFHGKHYQPDFISAYCFPYTPKKKNAPSFLSGYTAFTKGHSMQEKLQGLMEQQKRLNMDNLPLYITEYSAFLSVGNYINDSTYPGIYIMKQVVDTYGQSASLAYWLVSDISLSYHNYSAPLFGGNGIMSKDAIPKSSFYAYEFLNQLGDHLIAMGEHYIATCSDENLYQILFFYPATLNENFSNSLFSQELLQFPHSAFEETPSLDIRLQLTHLSSGTYLLKKQCLNILHGNILEAWRQLDHLKELRYNEINYLRQTNMPSIQMRLEQLDTSCMLQAVLNRNEAVLFTLELYERG